MSVEKNTASIKSLFEKGYSIDTSLTFEEIELLYQGINSVHSFVFIEGLSARFALHSFEKKNDLSAWNELYHYFQLNFAKQLNIGFGWAFGELNINPTDYLTNFSEENQSWVWNGYGYFVGTLKRRSVLRTFSFPDNIPNTYLHIFIQGFGRSLWYGYKGNVDKITKVISSFKEECQNDLWVGLGVAIAFVGGLSKQEWSVLKSHSANKELLKGFELAYPSLKDKETKKFLEEFFLHS